MKLKEVKTYWPNGQLLRHYFLNENKIYEGVYKRYYSNGQFDVKGFYKNGVLEGSFESYFPNGQLDVKGFYKNGVREGVYESYFPNGQFNFKCFYIKGKYVNKEKYNKLKIEKLKEAIACI